MTCNLITQTCHPHPHTYSQVEILCTIVAA